jgi:type IV pilus assembly protein PilE
MRHKSKQQGLTLIELMTTLAIIAIIGSIAWPAYESQSRKGKRPDGIAALEQVVQAEQRYFTDNNTFTTTVTNLPGIASTKSKGGYYDVTVKAGDTGNIATSFIATATAIGGQADDSCEAFIVHSNGKRDGTPDKQTCWGK